MKEESKPADLLHKHVRITAPKDASEDLKKALAGKEVLGRVINNPRADSNNDIYSIRLDAGHHIEAFSRQGPDRVEYVDLTYSCLEVLDD